MRSWAPKGIGQTVDSFPGRKSEKALGAVTVEKNPRFHFRFAPVFNVTTFGAFLRQVIRQYPDKKVHMVLDNASLTVGGNGCLPVKAPVLVGF